MALVLHGRALLPGVGEGEALVTTQPLGWLAGVDPERAVISDPSHELRGRGFAGHVLVYPYSVGSSVGSYVLYRLRRAGRAPVAIINRRADLITVSGCAIAHIPLVDLPKGGFERLHTGTRLRVDGATGEIVLRGRQRAERTYAG